MAGFNIHLAVGKRYFEKTDIIEDINMFYKGVLAPDLSDNKWSTHYTKHYDNHKSNLYLFLKTKVQLNEFLKNENIDSDYQRGVFLHLVTDYIFFNYFFDQEYLKKLEYDEFFKDLYYSYDETNDYIVTKYDVDFNSMSQGVSNNVETKRNKLNLSNEGRTNILSLDKLDDFIEYVSSINLDDYKERIIECGENVLPQSKNNHKLSKKIKYPD